MPVLTNLFSVSSMRSLKPGSPRSDLAMASTSSLSASLAAFSSLGASASSPAPALSSSPSEVASGTLARPSLTHTTTTSPVSPHFCAVRPTCTALESACASGEPPPHGMRSSLFFAIAIERVGGSSTVDASPWKAMSAILSRLWYAVVSRLIAAPLAAFIRLSAIEPLASTTKTMRLPALRAIFLDRTSDCSMYTGLGLVAPKRSRRERWNGAAARIVASTASRRTLPLGSIGLMYRPRSSEKMRLPLPDWPDFDFIANCMTSGSRATPSGSSMNSSGTAGGACSSSCSSSSSSSGSSSSCCSSSSSIWSCGGGGGGGCCIISSSSPGPCTLVPRGMMASFTASVRSSASTSVRWSTAADALATSVANISARWPCTPARIASSQR
mmetsp:Transcript_11968/g.31307  ORF Transcript_11968/g.31307 Transcript_11968/m.31307 type:complete len:385 (-) Transcript_11968:1068-2222(-)